MPVSPALERLPPRGFLGFLGQLANLLDHLELLFGAGVDGEADRGAAQAQSVMDAAGDRLILAGGVTVGTVQLEDRRYCAGEAVGAGFQQAERRGKGA